MNKDALFSMFWYYFCGIHDMLFAKGKVLNVLMRMVDFVLKVCLPLIVEAFKTAKPDRVRKFPDIDEVMDTRIDVMSFMAFFGSNSGRLYTHTDTKLLKNGGGSSW